MDLWPVLGSILVCKDCHRVHVLVRIRSATKGDGARGLETISKLSKQYIQACHLTSVFTSTQEGGSQANQNLPSLLQLKTNEKRRLWRYITISFISRFCYTVTFPDCDYSKINSVIGTYKMSRYGIPTKHGIFDERTKTRRLA